MNELVRVKRETCKNCWCEYAYDCARCNAQNSSDHFISRLADVISAKMLPHQTWGWTAHVWTNRSKLFVTTVYSVYVMLCLTAGNCDSRNSKRSVSCWSLRRVSWISWHMKSRRKSSSTQRRWNARSVSPSDFISLYVYPECMVNAV